MYGDKDQRALQLIVDTLPGVPPAVIGYLNYGEVDVWGFDASLAILYRKWNMDVTYSYMGTTDFMNPLTVPRSQLIHQNIRQVQNYNLTQLNIRLPCH